MARVVPTVQDMRDRFPEFSDVTDAIIQFAITDALRFVTLSWPDDVYTQAVTYLAAHFVYLSTVAKDEVGGALLQRMRTISYGPMSVGFSQTQKSSSAKTSGPLQTPSIYLERFRMYQPDSWAAVVLDGSHHSGGGTAAGEF